MTEWHLIGGDPAPGRPDGIRATSRSLLKTAEGARLCVEEFNSIAGGWADAPWTGEAADKFREHLKKLPDDLEKLNSSYLIAGAALRDYADDLETLQKQAGTAVASALTASKAKDAAAAQAKGSETAQSNAATKRKQFDGQIKSLNKSIASTAAAGGDTTSLQRLLATARKDRSYWADKESTAASDLTKAQNAEKSAAADLAGANRIAADIRALRENHRDSAVRKIDLASEVGIQNRNFVQRGVDFVTAVVSGDLDAIASLERAFKEIAKWAGAAALICSVLALIPVVGVAFGALAVALAWTSFAFSAAALVCTIVLFANGRRNFGDVLLGSIDTVLAFVGAKAVGSAMHALKDTVGKPLLHRAGTAALRQSKNKGLVKFLHAKGPTRLKMLREYVLRDALDVVRPIKHWTLLALHKPGPNLLKYWVRRDALRVIVGGRNIYQSYVDAGRLVDTYRRDGSGAAIREAAWNQVNAVVPINADRIVETAAAGSVGGPDAAIEEAIDPDQDGNANVKLPDPDGSGLIDVPVSGR